MPKDGFWHETINHLYVWSLGSTQRSRMEEVCFTAARWDGGMLGICKCSSKLNMIGLLRFDWSLQGGSTGAFMYLSSSCQHQFLDGVSGKVSEAQEYSAKQPGSPLTKCGFCLQCFSWWWARDQESRCTSSACSFQRPCRLLSKEIIRWAPWIVLKQTGWRALSWQFQHECKTCCFRAGALLHEDMLAGSLVSSQFCLRRGPNPPFDLSSLPCNDEQARSLLNTKNVSSVQSLDFAWERCNL